MTRLSHFSCDEKAPVTNLRATRQGEIPRAQKPNMTRIRPILQIMTRIRLSVGDRIAIAT